MLSNDAKSGVSNWVSNAEQLISMFGINGANNKTTSRSKMKENLVS